MIYKTTFDYVELFVEPSGSQWRLRLHDRRHGDEAVHEDEFDTAEDAKDAALPFVQNHILVGHDETVLDQTTLTWH
jgi:hypothetical protein